MEKEIEISIRYVYYTYSEVKMYTRHPKARVKYYNNGIRSATGELNKLIHIK